MKINSYSLQIKHCKTTYYVADFYAGFDGYFSKKFRQLFFNEWLVSTP